MHYKKITSEKKGFPPSPQVFRNSFKKMYGAELRYGLKNEKNYIWKPSKKRDYTNSFGCHSQPLAVPYTPNLLNSARSHRVFQNFVVPWKLYSYQKLILPADAP